MPVVDPGQAILNEFIANTRRFALVDYLVCGLSVRSELLLPGIVRAEAPVSGPDVLVRRATVPLPYTPEQEHGLNWRVDGADVLFRVPGIVRFLIADGRQVEFELEASGRDDDVVPFFLSTVVGVLLHQRQRLVLHASAVSFKGQAIAICGPSGVGKSTLAAALCEAGCSFVSDDVSVIHTATAGRPLLIPDGRQHRLWADSVARLSLNDRQGAAVRASLQKFHVDPAGEGQPVPVPLQAIVVLREARGPHRPGLVQLSSADAVALLRNDVFRGLFASRLGRDAQLFVQIAALLGQVQVFRLDRHADFARLGDDVRLVLGCLDSVK